MQEIRTEHLTVGYDKTPLIGDVNLSVRPGEILTLIGPNGSGKSTILKTITKQLKKLDGTVFLGEASMDELKDSQISRRLSMVMTERLRTELMSGREVVASGRYPYTGRFGILSKEDWANVDEAIALVHEDQRRTAPASDACAGNLSGYKNPDIRRADLLSGYGL